MALRLRPVEDTALRLRPVSQEPPRKKGVEDVADSYRAGLVRSSAALARAVPALNPITAATTPLRGFGVNLDIPEIASVLGGGNYEPQTRAGRYARSVGDFTPNVVMGLGSVPARVAQTVVPAITAEAAREAAENSGAGAMGQAGAQFAGALAGGGVSGARVGRNVPRLRSKPGTQARVLEEIGVELTPGRRAGGVGKMAEDVATRFPVVGLAIRDRNNRSIEQLNRGVALTALERVGKPLPKTVAPGHEMVRYVDDAIGEVYEQALDMVPVVRRDADLDSAMAAISARTVDLPEGAARDFQRIIADRLTRLGDEVDGRTLKRLHSELGNVQRKYAGSGDAGQAMMADLIGDVRRELMALVGRNSPEAAEMIARADDAWSVYSIMNKAAAKTADGVYTPSQLDTAVKQAANQYSNRAAGRGEGRLQDISSAARKIMPDTFGNPGTADAVGSLALAGSMMTPAGVPLLAATAAAATPYLRAGRTVLTRLPARPSREQIANADRELARLAQQDPAVNQLRAELARKYAVAGVATAQTASSQQQSRREPPRRAPRSSQR